MPACVYDAIWDRNFTDYVTKWRTHADYAHGPTAALDWDWNAKRELLLRGQDPSAQGLALEAEGETQGLVAIAGGQAAKLPSAAGKELLHVLFLEVAPWNQRREGRKPRFSSVGSRLLVLGAIRQSFAKGYNGRIGLTSLPGAASFYRELRMTEVGSDGQYPNFELDEAVAREHALRSVLERR